MNIALTLLFLLTAVRAGAIEAPADPEFDQMKEFMREENERIKAIKILNLDLERSNLELKKKEIEVKLADLNKNQSVHIQASDSFRPSAVKLAGIFVHGDGRQALFEVDGTYVHAGQGEQVKEGVLVKEIKNDKVILEFKDGKQQTFILGS